MSDLWMYEGVTEYFANLFKSNQVKRHENAQKRQ
jgi:predicted metalloprotease with PDZ domain